MSVIDVGRKAILFLSGAFALGIASETAFAQGGPPAPAPQPLEEITVTGSRIVRSNYSAQTPIVTVGKEDFEVRDKSRNVNWLAILSFGESWHNLHHADPTCARHGVEKGQIDSSARVIWLFEKLGWATDVRWPKAKRIDARRVAA